MKIITKWEELENLNNITLIIGNFDGVHLGHQELIKTAKRISTNEKIVLLTFNPHPVEYFSQQPFLKLTPEKELNKILKELKLDYWFNLQFNYDVANMSAEQFIKTISQHCILKNIVVGFNFKFGKGKHGNVDYLDSLKQKYNYNLHVVKAVHLPNMKENISSTLIRSLLAKGELQTANEALARNYSLFGTVVHGKKLGRKLGFPTANIKVSPDKLIPADGVYAGLVNKKLLAAVSIGLNPSFNENKRTIEVYILNYEGDLYDQELKLELTEYLRPQIKFESKEELVEQIRRDVGRILGE